MPTATGKMVSTAYVLYPSLLITRYSLLIPRCYTSGSRRGVRRCTPGYSQRREWRVTGIHSIVGSAVLVLFLISTIIYAIGIGGRVIAAGKYVSYLASLFLVIQYLLGIGLLSSGYRNKWYHYLFAVIVLIPIGMEHGYVRKRFSGRDQAINLTLVSAATTILVLVTYLIGRNNA